MDYSVMKKYVVLNRRRLNPGRGDCRDSAQMDNFTAKTKELQAKEYASVKKVSDAIRHRGEMDNQSPHLLIPILAVAIAAAVMVLIQQKMEVPMGLTVAKLRWIMYILLGIGTGIQIVMFSSQDRFLPILPLGIWYLFCVYFGWIRRVMLFGSEFNWLWVILAGDLLIICLVRLLEHFRKVLHNKRVYSRNCKDLEETEQLVDEMAQIYSNLGDAAAEEQAALIREYQLPWKPEPRTPWFTFQRETDHDYGWLLELPRGYDAKTDFKGFKPYESATSGFRINVLFDEITFDPVDAAEARELVSSGKLAPFFDMGLPVLTNDMEYHVFRHKWKVEHVLDERYTYTEKQADRKALYEFDSETDIYEYHRFGGKAENYVASSNQGAYYRDQYLKEKSKARESLFNKEVEKQGRIFHSDIKNGDEIAYLEARTPDGKIVGYYTSNSVQAVRFTLEQQGSHYKLRPAMPANSDAQRWVLYETFLQAENKALDNSTEYK